MISLLVIMEGPSLSYHPVPALIRLVRHNLYVNRLRLLVIPRLESLSQPDHARDSIFLEKIFVVQVVKQNAQPLLRINDLSPERRGRFCFDSLHVATQDFVYWFGI